MDFHYLYRHYYQHMTDLNRNIQAANYYLRPKYHADDYH